jgi:hypothetical protein
MERRELLSLGGIAARPGRTRAALSASAVAWSRGQI